MGEQIRDYAAEPALKDLHALHLGRQERTQLVGEVHLSPVGHVSTAMTGANSLRCSRMTSKILICDRRAYWRSRRTVISPNEATENCGYATAIALATVTLSSMK